ncbi:unnamed protein product [Orchesella dallaii]|uniref:F-box domain-containing protein n=1 Tax=Orchesella dallaii TaxID=48710 RepID=A0ABP1RK56_9HEXA
MSYLIKEKMMRDKSVTLADSAVAIEENFGEKIKGRIEESASFDAKKEYLEVAGYHHFPADNVQEVWENVFEKMANNDKITFSKVCSEWHNWVSPKRTRFLFREMFPTLASCAEGLSIEELMQCRKICKSWSQDFDHENQTRPSHLLLDFENPEATQFDRTILIVSNEFNNAKKIKKFLQDMKSHQGNPFPGRYISLDFYKIPKIGRRAREDERLQLKREFWGKALELLEAFGSHVYKAYIRLELPETTEVYEYFHKCLLHLPNLKSLRVNDACNGIPLHQTRAFYQRNPLPQLPQLETIDITGPPQVFWSSVLESVCVPAVVKRLRLFACGEFRKDAPIPEAVYNFHNLEAIDAQISIEELERFGNVLGGTPPLTAVAFDFRNGKQEQEQDFVRVFKSLEVFGGSLTHVKIEAKFSHYSVQHALEIGFAINLPKLEKLELHGFTGPLDPLCQLGTLECLRISCSWRQLEEWQGSTVDFYGFEWRMEDSNVWEKIPSIQKIHLERCSIRIDKFPCEMPKIYHRNMLRLSSK